MVDEDLIVQIEAKIHSGIEVKVDEAVERAMMSYSGDPARRKELEMHADRAFKMLLARIERGMKIVPRALPPPIDANDEMDREARDKMFVELAAITSSIDFPPTADDPLLQLTHSNDGSFDRSER